MPQVSISEIRSVLTPTQTLLSIPNRSVLTPTQTLLSIPNRSVLTPTQTLLSRPNRSVLTPTQTLLSRPNRSVTKGLCSYCCQPMVAGANMILEDLQIYSHSSCFKCEVCHCPLGDLHVGDSMWLHRGTVHCESCFSTAREKYLL
ncbi:sciellin isoform X3 [Oncorhynchus tshawytscha]|uniref:sciellin isoform X3 n=1 Tax=Oncorhynchus tshawytscha TaxID=74940 RepID=UPI001C3D47EC|nr:sciellin isoform X3 [Oncorhynchus tshawytscha]